jgi:glucans biosynthesis protein C
MDRARSVGRRYDLDALRVLAVLLLIVFHSARVFDVFDPFYVKNPETSDALSWAVVAFLNPWHMPLLFVLAGAATWLALGHRGAKAYIGERARRLLIPFLFGVLLVVPPQAFLASRFRGDDGSVASFLGDYWTVEGDLTGYDGSFTPAHLWFIGFLFIFSLVALPLFVRWHGRRPRTRWLLFAMPLVLVAANELPAPNDGPQNPWYSLALFVAGFLLLADERAEGVVQRCWRPLLAAAVVTMTMAMLVWSSGTGDGWRDGSPVDVGFSVLEEANTWLWVLALLGAGKALLGSPIRGLRYASEASFPFYVLHQTVIVAVAFVVVGWNLGVWQKFTTVALASLVLTLLLYELVVRRTGSTRFLFGMKRSTGRPSSVTATASATSVKPKKSIVITPVSVKSVSRVPSASRRAMAKLELRPPVAPATTIRPSGWRAMAAPVSRPGTPVGELRPVTDTLMVPLSSNVASGVPSGSSRIADSSVTLPGGEPGGVVSAVPTSRSRPSGWMARPAPTKASRVSVPPAPKAGSG